MRASNRAGLKGPRPEQPGIPTGRLRAAPAVPAAPRSSAARSFRLGRAGTKARRHRPPRPVTRPASPPNPAEPPGARGARSRDRGRAARRLQLRRWRRRLRSETRGTGRTSRASSPRRGALPKPPEATKADGIWERSCPSASSPPRPALPVAARAAFCCGRSRSRARCRTTSECRPGERGSGAAAFRPDGEARSGRGGTAGSAVPVCAAPLGLRARA